MRTFQVLMQDGITWRTFRGTSMMIDSGGTLAIADTDRAVVILAPGQWLEAKEDSQND